MKVELEAAPVLVRLDSLRPESTFLLGSGRVYIKTDLVGLGPAPILVVDLGSGRGFHLSGGVLVTPAAFKVVPDTSA